jgi:hypothetical protein
MPSRLAFSENEYKILNVSRLLILGFFKASMIMLNILKDLELGWAMKVAPIDPKTVIKKEGISSKVVNSLPAPTTSATIAKDNPIIVDISTTIPPLVLHYSNYKKFAQK